MPNLSSAAIQKQYGFEHPFFPDPLVKKALRYCTNGRLLDLGCGEGADAVYLANRGFKVTAVDKSGPFLSRFGRYVKDNRMRSIRIVRSSALTYSYPESHFDVISSILAVCCMKRSHAHRVMASVKKSVRPGGVVIMSARNYKDPEFRTLARTGKEVEPNSFSKVDKCSEFMYFVEKDKLREVFADFDILYYFEGYAPCKYKEHPRHGDSYIICRRPA